ATSTGWCPWPRSQWAILPARVVLPEPWRPASMITVGGVLANLSRRVSPPRIPTSSSSTILMICCAGLTAWCTSAPCARSRTGDEHLAEDLVQTALTRLYVAWWRVEKDQGPEAYARRILVNTLVDERRRPWRRSETSRADLPEQPSDVVDVENADAVRRALAE